MKYDLSNTSELSDYKYKSEYFIQNKKTVELKGVKLTRSGQQNKALHKYFMFISDELNELGMEYRFFGVKGDVISLMYTPELVKKFFWKEIQKALFDFESTTKLDTKQMNQIIDVITKFFADKGVVIPFPSLDFE